MMQQKLVSVIVPCYNQGAYLAEALESVLEQTYPVWECIIINDGSTDNTDAVARLWEQKDTRFKYLSIPNGGVSNARNTGIAAAKGFYILPVDGDDKISPNYIETMIAVMDSDPKTKVAYGAIQKFGAVNERWKLSDFNYYWLPVTNMIHCTGLYRKSDFEALPGGYDVNMHEGLEDWEFWINFLKEGGDAKRDDSALLYYRVKEKSRMTGISLQKRYRLLAYIYNKHRSLYEVFMEEGAPHIKIDYAYSFHLSAKTYTPEDTERIRKFKAYYRRKLKEELEWRPYLKKKRVLFNWFRRGKLNLSFWDVLTK
jgi:glycosyltransferase involved in cell wall biosynthesis